MVKWSSSVHSLSREEAHRACTEVSEDPSFDASERLRRLLRYLGERSNSGGKSVSQHEIAHDVMGLGKDFDPKIDAHVRIEVRRLRRALDLYYSQAVNRGSYRITIPKGSYRPVLTPLGIPQIEPTRPSVEKLTIRTEISLSRELVNEEAGVPELLLSELRAHVFSSPVSKFETLSFPVVLEVHSDANQQRKRKAPADFILFARVYSEEKEWRLLLDFKDVREENIVISVRESFPLNLSPSRLVKALARAIATELCDPMIGKVPMMLAAENHDPSLKIMLDAYRFMSTQNLALVSSVVEGIDWLTEKGKHSPQLQALHAEVARLAGRISGNQASTYEYLEMAEEALMAKPDDVTCQLAVGYARLNAGLSEAALETGRKILAEQTPTSCAYKARLLVSLADCEGTMKAFTAEDPVDYKKPFYMKEFSGLVTKIRWGEIEEADKIITSSLHPNIFWLHVFHTAVLVEAGELDRARRTANKLTRFVPNHQKSLPQLCKSFFPKDNEHEYLIRGLRDAGLVVQM